MNIFRGFRDFVLRGNVIDLAVGVVIGGAFGTVVNALVKDLLTPFIAAIAKAPDFSSLSFTINGSQFMYGDFLNALISFVLVAAAIYFAIVLPMNKVMSLSKKKTDTSDAPSTKTCTECLSSIPAGAKRCAHCTSVIA